MHADSNSVRDAGPATVLVVGLGFIGRDVARLAIDRGMRVRAIARRRPQGLDERVDVLIGDAADPHLARRAMQGVDHVVFAAGTARPADSAQDPLGECQANLAPLLAVLDAAAEHGGPHITFLSSGGTVYQPGSSDPVDEDAPLWPLSPYGVLKVAAERFVGMYVQAHGLTADILRCANVYGPGQPTEGSQGVIGIFGAALAAGRELTVFGDGEALRDFVYVGDVSDVALRLAPTADGLRVFNVGSGESVSINRVISAIADRLGATPVVRYVSARSSDAPAVRLDVSRLQTTLDYHPLGLEAGLARMEPAAVVAP